MLIVCLGILVVLAVMATTLLSVVGYQRKISQSYRRRSLTELAALAGRDDARAFLDAEAGTTTTLHGDWARQFEMLRINNDGSTPPDPLNTTFNVLRWAWDGSAWTPETDGGSGFTDYPNTDSGFVPKPGSTPNDVTDFGATTLWNFLADPQDADDWENPYLADPYPDDRQRNGWARWITLEEYDKDWRPLGAGGGGHYRLRYAVGIVDLSGRLLVNPHEDLVGTPTGGLTDIDPDLWAERLGALLEYDADETVPDDLFPNDPGDRDAAEAIYQYPYNATAAVATDDNPPIHSFGQMRRIWDEATPTHPDAALSRLTPFGDLGYDVGAGEEPGAEYIGWRVNVLTAPRSLLEGMVWGLHERYITTDTGTEYGSDDDSDFGVTGLEELELLDGADDPGGYAFQVGPLDDLAGEIVDLTDPDLWDWQGSGTPPTWDTTSAGPYFEILGDPVTISDGSDFFYDIAQALFTAVNTLRYEAAADPASGDLSMGGLQQRFIETLDPWDITRVYNAAWERGQDINTDSDPEPEQREWKMVTGGGALTLRAARMELALNDTLQSLWGDVVVPFDAEPTDPAGGGPLQGVFRFDWDGSDAVHPTGGTPGTDTLTWTDTGPGLEEYWSRLDDPIFNSAPEYQEYPANDLDAHGNHLHGPPDIIDYSEKTGGYPGDPSEAVFREGESTTDANDPDSPHALSATGEWYIGPSRFWHVVVRAELVREVGPDAPAVIARSDLEFVYVNDPDADGDPSDGHVLYQRWIQRGD